ncbi:YcxB family protein [Ancylothrix sp. C2]|uniref:YcxB family protein n=1 Tax=Ancylothrix sp. D3o TaxID=2953691 RepID=UPI0021BAFFE8|nr:YcxB family protein [Ancylothrix sp. D3o]MCT7949337.1 YcxB family protein [Ancylothrix sp. D3o]
MENINIKTKEYNITEKQFFKIISSLYYKRSKINLIIWGLLFVVNLVPLFTQPLSSALPGLMIWVIFFAILYGLTPLLAYKTAAQNKFVFQKTRVEIDIDFFTFFYDDGSLFKYRVSNFHKAENVREFYFLYVTKASIYYIPKAAFYTEADLQLFELMLKSKKLLA